MWMMWPGKYFAGKLQFIIKCHKPGRCLMSRILAEMKKLKKPSHKIYFNQDFKKDIAWWLKFLPHFVVLQSSNPFTLVGHMKSSCQRDSVFC